MKDHKTQDREKVGEILDRFNQVEGLIDEIITAYVNPIDNNKKFFMYSILLNTSITPSGSKVKVLLRINEIENYVNIESHHLYKKKRGQSTVFPNMLGIDQPKVSNLVRGKIRGFSMDRLFRYLTILGTDIDIFVNDSSRTGNRPGRMKVAVA